MSISIIIFIKLLGFYDIIDYLLHIKFIITFFDRKCITISLQQKEKCIIGKWKMLFHTKANLGGE